MNIKENKAITLIALVVTIIILIILAGISLNLVLGEHGLITLAKKAKENMELAQIQEQEELNQLYEQLYNGGGSSGGLEPAGQEIKEDNYGEYVDYGLDINNDGDTTNDWKIFYTNDDGRIFLIAADYVPATCEALQTAIDANHANMSMDGNYKYYWTSNSVPNYDCNDGHNKTLNQDKEQCSFPELFMPSTEFCTSDNHYYCSDYVGNDGAGGYEHARCASALQCKENWSSFVTQSTKSDCADYAIGGPTIEMWVASWNKVHGTDTEVEGKKGMTLYTRGIVYEDGHTGYYIGTQSECSNQSFDLSKCEGYNDSLYFLDKSNSKCVCYWLASPSADGSGGKNIMSIGCSNGFVSRSLVYK